MRDAGPDQVHVDRQRGGRCRRREPALQLRCLRQPESAAAVGRGDEDLQVTGGLQLREVLVEEGVVAVIAGGAAADPFQQRFGKDVFGRHAGVSALSSW